MVSLVETVRVAADAEHRGNMLVLTLLLFFLFPFLLGATSTSVSLHWVNNDIQSPAPTFPIERGPDGVTWTQIAETAEGITAYTDTGLAPSTTYFYRVKARNFAGDSAYSNIASGTTLAAALPPPVELVAAYACNEGAGTTTADATGNNNNGTLVGTTWVAGKNGLALSFNGTGNYVNAGSGASVDDLVKAVPATFSFWMNPGTPTNNLIIAKNDGNVVDAGWWIENTSSSGLRFVVERASSNMRVGVSSPTAGVWTHVAIVYDGTLIAANQNIYFNGVLQTFTTVLDGSGTQGSDAGETLFIGFNRPTSGSGIAFSPYNGLLDDIRIYNRALTQTEIQTDMNTPVGAIPTGLAANVSVTLTTQP